MPQQPVCGEMPSFIQNGEKIMKYYIGLETSPGINVGETEEWAICQLSNVAAAICDLLHFIASCEPGFRDDDDLHDHIVNKTIHYVNDMLSRESPIKSKPILFVKRTQRVPGKGVVVAEREPGI